MALRARWWLLGAVVMMTPSAAPTASATASFGAVRNPSAFAPRNFRQSSQRPMAASASVAARTSQPSRWRRPPPRIAAAAAAPSTKSPPIVGVRRLASWYLASGGQSS
jgi:hypothetical protein